jgi:hypothetical protein
MDTSIGVADAVSTSRPAAMAVAALEISVGTTLIARVTTHMGSSEGKNVCSVRKIVLWSEVNEGSASR